MFNRMLQRCVLTMVLAGCASLAPAVAWGQVELRWKFAPGDVLRIQSRQSDQHVVEVSQRIEANVDATISDMEMRVVGVTDQGAGQFEIEFTRFQYEYGEGAGIARIDTKQPNTEASPELSGLLEIYLQLVGIVYRGQMEPLGAMGDVELDEASRQRIEAAPNGELVRRMLDSGLTQQLIRGALLKLPEEPLQPGSEWSDPRCFITQNLGGVDAEVVYRYGGTEQREGRTLHKIQIIVDGAFGEALKNSLPADVAVDNLSFVIGGVAYFDAEAGYMTESVMTQKFSFEAMGPMNDKAKFSGTMEIGIEVEKSSGAAQ